MEYNKKLSKKQKILYGLGDFGSQFIWTFTGSYLSIFYTDIVGLAPAIVSAIMFGARIWDAINDPMFGAIAERTKTKYGRFRPYILFGTPFMALFCVLTFSAPFTGNGSVKVIWATATYIILGMLYTAVNLSYGSLSSVMSVDSEDRIELNFWRMIGANVGQLILNAVSMPLILFFSMRSAAGQQIASSKGYLITAFIFAIITLMFFIIVFKNSREVVYPKAGEKIPLKVSLKTIFTNKPFILVFLMLIFYVVGLNIHTGLLIYYITYVMERTDLASILMTVPSIFAIIVMFLTKGIVDKAGKKKMLLVSYIGMAAATVLLGMTDPKNIFLVIVFQSIWGIFKFASPILMGSVPECVDYAEDKYGMRCDGIAYSFAGLATKIGPALGPSIGLLALGSGYVANGSQSAETVANINFAVNYLPAIFMLLGIIPVLLYPLNKARNEEIKRRLAKKRENSPSSGA